MNIFFFAYPPDPKLFPESPKLDWLDCDAKLPPPLDGGPYWDDGAAYPEPDGLIRFDVKSGTP